MTDEVSLPKRRRRFVSGPRKLLGAVVLIVSGSVFYLFFSGQVMTFEIDGRSMVPTLMPGERVFVKTRIGDSLARGDLVVFHNPMPHLESEILIKRVIALPGDRLEILSHRLYVNGVRERPPGLPELFVADLDDETFTLGDDEIYVLGDNRPLSCDSTEFGPLQRSAVDGRLTFCYWPLTHLRHVN